MDLLSPSLDSDSLYELNKNQEDRQQSHQKNFENGNTMRHNLVWEISQSHESSTNATQLSQNEWTQIFMYEKDIFIDFSRERIFNTLFSYVGVEDSTRGLIWIKLLQAEELRDGAEPNSYQKMVAATKT